MNTAPQPDLPPDWPHQDCSRLLRVSPHVWHVQEMGAGPLVLLVHGAGGSCHSWRGLMPLLAQNYHVIAVDLPGQGFSRMGARGRAGLAQMSADIAKLCAHQGWQPAALIGHSAGAAIALDLAQRLTPSPRAIIGINAALDPFQGMAGWLFPLTAKMLTLAPFVPAVFARLTNTDARVANLIAATGSTLDPQGLALYRHLVAKPSHVDATLAMMAQWRLPPLLESLPSLRQPVLLITAENDRAVSPQTSARAVARMTNAQHVALAHHGHLVQEEDPAAVMAALAPWLTTQLIPAPNQG
jgi:magnesium chelatase accessory protein